jgi:hypothetical protein
MLRILFLEPSWSHRPRIFLQVNTWSCMPTIPLIFFFLWLQWTIYFSWISGPVCLGYFFVMYTYLVLPFKKYKAGWSREYLYFSKDLVVLARILPYCSQQKSSRPAILFDPREPIKLMWLNLYVFSSLPYHAYDNCLWQCDSMNSGTSSQAPKSGTAKPNSDCGKSVKLSMNSPIYQKGMM